MGKRHAGRLVIDADVAHSAGTSEHPVASASRVFLHTVYDFGYHVVMTEAIRESGAAINPGTPGNGLPACTAGGRFTTLR